MPLGEINSVGMTSKTGGDGHDWLVTDETKRLERLAVRTEQSKGSWQHTMPASIADRIGGGSY